MMKNTISVIALCGKKRSGKNTASEALISAYQHKRNCVEVSFAEPIKKCVAELFGFTKDQVDGDKKEIPDPHWENLTPRYILQFFGTEMMQYKLQEMLPKTGRHFWCNRLIKKIQTLPENSLVIITDLRFKHEYEALKSTFGNKIVFLKIERLIDHDENNLEQKSDNHSSEKEVDSIIADVIIHNNHKNHKKEDFQKKCVEDLEKFINK